MADRVLLDTGFFVALIDKDEKQHLKCVDALEKWNGQVITSEAVLTETLYLVGESWYAQKASLQFVIRGAVSISQLSLLSIHRVEYLMEKYHDIPMDYADATLVVLAEELDIDTIFTLDRKGFSAYRIKGKKIFKIIP